MYGIYRPAPDLTQITLPPPAGVPLPHGFPTNVYLVGKQRPVLVDTGWAGSSPALIRALDELSVPIGRIRHVLLTSHRPEAVGNVALFDRAQVIAATDDESERVDATAHAGSVVAELRKIAQQLLDDRPKDAGHADWTPDAVESFEAAWVSGLPEPFDVRRVEDGERFEIDTGGQLLDLEARHAPGVDEFASAFHERESDRLYVGPTMRAAIDPQVRDARAYTETLSRLTAVSPRVVLPAQGAIERDFRTFFRTVSLWINNLVSNLPHLLDEPTTIPEILYRDIGVWPSDLVRFATTAKTYLAVLEELDASGVVKRKGGGIWSRWVVTGHEARLI